MTTKKLEELSWEELHEHLVAIAEGRSDLMNDPRWVKLVARSVVVVMERLDALGR